ncbi:hypothetical protein R9C00_13225 [Flammeovirgaceae bacterium SG7u.111]|nr:hypothetical protein [Flammeovirgaceae bacterium SG7u.132]WPO38418.1 hypothetical protein R9C00_13225 [Flammeovirgaceae bacterium SG7u.111]
MNKYFFIILMLIPSTLVLAQNTPSSPYTYFGIGDIYQKGFGHNAMKGGTGIADRDPFSINNLNPASYSSIANSPFTFLNEFGLSAYMSTRNDGDENGVEYGMDFPYLAVAFKTGNSSGASIGLRKYSNVNYSILSESNFNGITGSYQTNYEGSGGLNEVYFGYGKSFGRNLSIGVHGSYIFGQIENTQTIQSSTVNYSMLVEDKNFLRTLNYDLGIQYTVPIKSSSITIGATYAPSTDVTGSRDILIADTRSGIGNDQDTIAYEPLEDRSYILPHSYGLGIAWDYKSKFKVNVDYKTQLWGESDLSGKDYELRDSRRLAFGFEKLPNYKGNRYDQFVSWAIGAYAEESYLEISDEGLNSVGVTLGCSLPIGNKGMLRLVAERGTRGQGLENFFTESYNKLTIDITYMDRWFSKRRID